MADPVSADTINSAAFKKILDRYNAYIPSWVQILEDDRFIAIPGAIKERKVKFLTLQEVGKLGEWM